MSSLYTRLTDLCAQKGITAYRFCKDTGLQPSLMTDLKAGIQNGISAKKASKIATYFGVSTSFILYGKDDDEKEMPVPQIDISADEQQLISKFRLLKEQDKGRILERIDLILDGYALEQEKTLISAS